MLSYKFRIYPNKETRDTLDGQLKLCAFVYNKLLEEINSATSKNLEITQKDTQKLLIKLKKENPELDNVYSKALQMVNNMLWYNIRSINSIKKRGKRFGGLRFKAENGIKIINYNQSGFRINLKSKKIDFSKIGTVNVKLHRNVEGKVKGIIIKKEDWNWFVILQTDSEVHLLPKTGRNIGIDMGIKHIVVDSEGNMIENPHFVERNIERIKMIHRNLSRKNRNSKNYQKEKQKLQKQYIKTNNRRRDFLHKLSRHYVNNFDIIAIENLDSRKLIEKGSNRTLHRNISDSAWRMYRNMLSYKAERAGRQLVIVDPKDTSQTCSRCGSVNGKEDRLHLQNRTYYCKNCGFEADRDYNAAVNILRSGQGLPKAPLETVPLLRIIPYEYINSGKALSMNKETNVFRHR